MKFQIQHEVPGRLRVQCLAQEGRMVKYFTLEQGAAILVGLQYVPGVKKSNCTPEPQALPYSIRRIRTAPFAKGSLLHWPGLI